MKKTLLVSLAAVLVFGLMGLGFAMWSDTVTVSASVNTGNVQVGIRDVGTNDNILTTDILGGEATNDEDGLEDAMDLGGDPQVLPGVNEEGKNVASMISVNNGDDPYFTLGETDYFTAITETIENAYPYYAPTTRFEIACNGTIPVKLDKINIVETGDLSGLTCESYTVTYPNGETSSFNRDGELLRFGFDQLVNDLAMLQLHYGDVVTVDLQVSFAQETEQGSSGAITLTVHAAQWNEAGQDDPYSDIF